VASTRSRSPSLCTRTPVKIGSASSVEAAQATAVSRAPNASPRTVPCSGGGAATPGCTAMSRAAATRTGPTAYGWPVASPRSPAAPRGLRAARRVSASGRAGTRTVPSTWLVAGAVTSAKRSRSVPASLTPDASALTRTARQHRLGDPAGQQPGQPDRGRGEREAVGAVRSRAMPRTVAAASDSSELGPGQVSGRDRVDQPGVSDRRCCRRRCRRCGRRSRRRRR